MSNSLAIFCFYDLSNGPQAWMAFSDEFKHCNVVTFDGSDWVIIDFIATGITNRVIKVTKAARFLRALKTMPNLSAYICVEIQDKAKVRWKPFMIRSCNEICRYASGIDIGLTFNPRHLHHKLLKYDTNKGYTVLGAWRRKHGTV